jgi:hypothetical protein
MFKIFGGDAKDNITAAGIRKEKRAASPEQQSANRNEERPVVARDTRDFIQNAEPDTAPMESRPGASWFEREMGMEREQLQSSLRAARSTPREQPQRNIGSAPFSPVSPTESPIRRPEEDLPSPHAEYNKPVTLSIPGQAPGKVFKYTEPTIQHIPLGTTTKSKLTMSPAVPDAPWQLPVGPGHPINSSLRPAIEEAATKFGVPNGVLESLIMQETHFDPKYITGEVRSSAGASGVAQIIPHWHPEIINLFKTKAQITASELKQIEAAVDNPLSAIPYAAWRVRRWGEKYGSFPWALVAYNWGPDHVKDVKKGSTNYETAQYLRAIHRRTPMLGMDDPAIVKLLAAHPERAAHKRDWQTQKAESDAALAQFYGPGF